jgi:hypothetical protein
MVAVTYDAAHVSIGKAKRKAAAAEAGAPGKAWYLRFMDALIESRVQQAQREIARHIHLLPYTLDERGSPLISRGRHDVPFGGW